MKYEVAAVDRALILLEALAEQSGLGVTELAERTGNTKSLVFRLLFTLENRGYVYKDPEARTYSLGYRTLFLADQTRRQSRLIVTADRILRRLAVEAQENALLTIRRAVDSLCIAMRESPQPLRLFAQVGRRGPLHAGGGPKVLLAHAPEAVRKAVLDGPLEALTPTTITDPRTLAKSLDDIRRSGFTLSIGEMDQDVFSMAAPVRDYTGDVVAAISAAGPVSRLAGNRRENLRVLVLEMAAELSAELGHEADVEKQMA